MALAVCLLFDARTERLLRELWGRVGESLGLEGPQAHVLETVEEGDN